MTFSEYDQLLSPVIILNNKNEIVYYNFICSTFFQSSPRKLNKIKSINELFSNINYDLSQTIKEVQQTSSFAITPEVTFANSETESVTVIMKFIPLEEGNNILINILDFSIEKRLHDKYKEQITELKNTHEQIVKADKLTALGEVIAGIGHEVGTPLVIMNSIIDNLEESLSSNDIPSSFDNLDKLSGQFNRVVKIFSELKSIVKNQEEILEIVDLNKTIEEVLDFFSDLGNTKNINIVKSSPSYPIWVMGNSIKLQQVLINLIKNSIQAFGGYQVIDPEIRIELFHRSETQTNNFKIIDNGPGVELKSRDKIFDMFYTSKEVDEGTGLGLSISRRIIESFSGSLELNEVENGCEFEVAIPDLEMGSFTMTNRYITGETDSEDEKVLVFCMDIEVLNQVHKILTEANFVLVYTPDSKRIEELTNFLLVDHIVLLNRCNLMNLDVEPLDLSTKPVHEQLEILGSKFGKAK